VKRAAEHLGIPVIEAAEATEDRGGNQDLMEMGDYEVGVMSEEVQGWRGQHDTGDPPNKKTKRKPTAKSIGVSGSRPRRTANAPPRS
jgi:hypothetical protein